MCPACSFCRVNRRLETYLVCLYGDFAACFSINWAGWTQGTCGTSQHWMALGLLKIQSVVKPGPQVFLSKKWSFVFCSATASVRKHKAMHSENKSNSAAISNRCMQWPLMAFGKLCREQLDQHNLRVHILYWFKALNLKHLIFHHQHFAFSDSKYSKAPRHKESPGML